MPAIDCNAQSVPQLSKRDTRHTSLNRDLANRSNALQELLVGAIVTVLVHITVRACRG